MCLDLPSLFCFVGSARLASSVTGHFSHFHVGGPLSVLTVACT